AVDQGVTRFVGGRRHPGQVEHGDEVVRCGYGRGEVGVVHQRQDRGRVAGEHLSGSIVESSSPVEALADDSLVDATQVVDDVAAAEDQDVVLTQGGEPSAHLEVVLEGLVSV